jgi:hypothetical protein
VTRRCLRARQFLDDTLNSADCGSKLANDMHNTHVENVGIFPALPNDY